MRYALLCVSIACAAPPRYLGAPLPDACGEGDIERCAGWLAERDLVAGQLDAYDDPKLRAYVQQIADRLAHGALLARGPRIVIGEHDGAYAAFGERIVIGRMVIERLGSEAELAAIVAHELVHVEGRHASLGFHDTGDESWLEARRDAEAIADERAVALLARAGYAPAAMPRALEAVLETDDDEHPPRVARLAAVKRLAANRRGYEGREELLARIEGMVVGRNTELGMRVGDAWVVGVLGIALALPSRHVVHVDGDALVIRHGRSSLAAYPVGAAWARELGDRLVERAEVETALGPLTVGIAPPQSAAATRIDKLQQVVRELLPQPRPGAWVVVLERPRGGLMIELAEGTDPYVRDRWLSGLRAASKAELAAVAPMRIELHRAEETARISELVVSCPDEDAALRLDDPDRLVRAGEPYKCTDR